MTRARRVGTRAARILGFPVVALALLGTGGCDLVRSNFLGEAPAQAEGRPGFVEGFLGGAVADEPRAALAARDVLSAGGSAADAAVAAGFTLAVTLPSRASLGGGGACLSYAPDPEARTGGAPEAILFTAPAPAVRASGADPRPAAVPMLARGLFALHARYGKRPFEELVAPAEQLARFGVPASRALARDVAVVAAPLAGDPLAAAVFVPGGQPIAEGAKLLQPDLGSTLAQLRTAGVGDLYQGTLARRVAETSALAGGPIGAADLRSALPQIVAPVFVDVGRDRVAVPPTDGGLAAAASLLALRAGEPAGARGLAVAQAARRGGADPALLTASLPAGNLPPLPASTTFATLDRDGNAVICALTMNNLFGTGRIAPGTGVVLAASPAAFPQPLLSVMLAYNDHLHAFRALSAGSGQAGAPLAAALALQQELSAAPPDPAPEPGRATSIGCARYLPGTESSCAGRTDPRGAGLATGNLGGRS